MKHFLNAILIPAALVIVISTGCSNVPQEEIDSARASIDQAKLAGAERYTPDLYLALQDSMNAVLVRLESEQSKLIKNFSDIKVELEEVIQLADEVTLKTGERKEMLKEEILATISEVKSLIDENRKLLLEAPRGKEGTSALVAIRGEIDAVDAAIDEARIMMDQGDYLTIHEKALAARVSAENIHAELSGVIATYKSNVRNRVG